MINRREMAETVGKKLGFSARQKGNDKRTELREKEENVFKEVSMMECKLVFEEVSFVLNSRTHNFYLLSGIQPTIRL